MRHFTAIRVSLASAALIVTGGTAQAHWDLPSCYIEVHDGCFNSQPPCSEEDYDGFLDECDDAYPASAPVQRTGYNQLIAPSQQVIRSRAYRQKIQRMKALVQ